jgi:hypothetical protein
VLADAARAGIENWWRILAVAVAVSVVGALAQILVEVFVDRANISVSLVTDLTASVVSLLGAVFLSGFLCRLVGGNGDKEDTSIRHVARTLPWWRLIGADLLVVLVVVIGLIALVVPGLIAANLLAVTGPVIDIENRSVIAALRRSAHLVRGHFWAVALLATLPVMLVSEIDVLGPHPTSLTAVIELMAIRGPGDAIIEAAIGLILVKLCYRLIALERVRAGLRMSRR